MVHDLFEEQTSVEAVVSKIMQRAQTLLKCERCVVVLDQHQPAAAAVSLASSSLSSVAGPAAATATSRHVITQSPVSAV